RDERFCGNPLVSGEPHLRFYAGVLLRTPEGLPIGTVCVLDFETRDLKPDQIDSLKVLARHTMSLLELRLSVAKLDQAVEYREQLLGIVSHDLRTPLGAIRMTAEMLAERPDSNPEFVGKSASRIIRSSESMEQLIHDLLDHDSLERNEVRFRIGRTEVSGIFQDLDDRFSGIAREKEIDFRTELKTELPELYCDPERTLQLLSNLCSNALRFTEKGGCVCVSACRAGDDTIKISVEDTGRGIPPGNAKSIFEPFWQVEKNSGGFGLGLSIVKKLAERQAGTVHLDTSWKDGARFVVALPIQQG
ncbi:MAG: GAF domain-containing sensor histidine kinase, partial [Verrucomicrobiales bacterium]|nr:GAF domain-containing sensor histidine kinase [Verrucomicrobiales bacterium]